MKKFLILVFLIFLVVKVNSSDSINGFPNYFFYYYDSNSQKNFFPLFYYALEEKHGIKVFYLKDNKQGNDAKNKTKEFFKSQQLSEYEKIILIYLNIAEKKGKILVSDNLRQVFSEKIIKILENDVLNKLIGRWYISEFAILTKIVGTLYYMLEKNKISKKQIDEYKSQMILIDDPFFILSTKKPFSDIINLFYLEPISFIFYFPFITYFIFVRTIGYNSGLNGFRLANILWVLFMFFISVLIFNKINIIFHEYIGLFSMFCGLNLPVYLFLYYIYNDRIESAMFGYIEQITGGGFNENIF